MMSLLVIGCLLTILAFAAAGSLSGSRLRNRKGLCPRVLPALVDRLQTVAVGIEYVRSVITRIIIEACARLTVVSRAGCQRCLVEGVHLGLALGNKANMSSP